jgi:hypothetical protein
MATRIGIIGAGAIGSIVGGMLTKAGHDVTLMEQWPEHVEAMKKVGLRLSGTCGEHVVPVKALHIHEVQGLREPFDAVFVAVKSYVEGGGHGLEVRTEEKQQFLYVTAYQQVKSFAKLTLKGETVWEKHAPMESGLYPAGEDTKPEKRWGRDAFMPTNYAFLPDGGFFLADGYGSYRIHRYDKDGNWKSMFGEPGTGSGQFNTPHGVWIDNRPGREPSVIVADRANKRLQWFTFEGKHLKTLDGFILPANIDIRKDVLLIPDLSARITLLDGKDQVIAHLGEDPEWRAQVVKDGMKLRKNQKGEGWVSGKFLHPHDACFDKHGNIFVAEWVDTGRITMLRKVG